MTLLIQCLQGILIMSVFYAFYWLALRQETLFAGNRLYLLTTLFISLTLPFFKFNLNADMVQSGWLPSTFISEKIIEPSGNLLLGAQEGSSISLLSILLIVYLFGVMFMTGRLIFALRQINSIRKQGEKVVLQETTCILSEQVQSPFSFWNTIYLPAGNNYTENELKEVITHERTHIREHHSLDVLLMEMVTILCWFNPVVYLYKKALSDVHEYIADHAVLHFSHWENYAHLLIQQRYRQQPIALSQPLIYSQLKNRLKMMTKTPSAKSARLKYLGIAPVIAMALLFFSFTYQESATDQTSVSSSLETVVVEETGQPVFRGCEKLPAAEQQSCTGTKVVAYMSEHLVYPKNLEKEGVEGKVIAKFIVDQTGKVKDVTIVKSLQKDADLAVLALIRGMNEGEGHWIPATKEGKPVDAVMHLPVVFALGDKK